MKVLFATPELAPLVQVGGLAYAAAGLARALDAAGVDVTIALPDYETYSADLGAAEPLDMPKWVGITTLRRGLTPDGVPLVAIRPPEMPRPHPYTDSTGEGWPDNDFRFMAFSAAVARLSEQLEPDVVHLNDWHTGAVLGFLETVPASVFTIHNLAYQGRANPGWMELMTRQPAAYEWFGTTNPMSGAIALSDFVVTVSDNYAAEIRHPASGEGLDGALRARGDRLVGVRNGIDDEAWNPAADTALPASFDAEDLTGKRLVRRALLDTAGWRRERSPLLAMVTRLTGQKGVDLALDMAGYLHRLPMRMMILGSGERSLADTARATAHGHPDRVWFRDGFDEELAHHLFGGADMLLMPSRFEPCGLAQMQAMRYGTIPVVTDVGGLHDTVVDADDHPDTGTGFMAVSPTPAALVDALHRAARAWRSPVRRRSIQRNGMSQDWGWTKPAARQIEIYEQAIAARKMMA